MVMVAVVVVVVATAVKGTIGSNLRAGNRNRGLAARASHTPQVLPGLLSFVLGPRNTYTWDSWQAGDRRAPESSTRTRPLLFGESTNRVSAATRDTKRLPSCRSLQSLKIDADRISAPFDCSLPLNASESVPIRVFTANYVVTLYVIINAISLRYFIVQYYLKKLKLCLH